MRTKKGLFFFAAFFALRSTSATTSRMYAAGSQMRAMRHPAFFQSFFSAAVFCPV